jgi:hypothetical protein
LKPNKYNELYIVFNGINKCEALLVKSRTPLEEHYTAVHSRTTLYLTMKALLVLSDENQFLRGSAKQLLFCEK